MEEQTILKKNKIKKCSKEKDKWDRLKTELKKKEELKTMIEIKTN